MSAGEQVIGRAIPVPTPVTRSLPVLATATQAYALLWRHRVLHLRAIWPPIVFLVTAEFL